MVYKKQLNEFGDYIGKDNNRYEIMYCTITESIEWIDTGEVDEYGNPIYERGVVINKGWDAFDSIEDAAAAYELTYSPLDAQ